MAEQDSLQGLSFKRKYIDGPRCRFYNLTNVLSSRELLSTHPIHPGHPPLINKFMNWISLLSTPSGKILWKCDTVCFMDQRVVNNPCLKPFPQPRLPSRLA